MSTPLDKYAAAALTGLIIRGTIDDAEELSRQAFRIARAMMDERLRQGELPPVDAARTESLNSSISVLDLPLRVVKKLEVLGIATVRDLTLTTERAIRATGLKDESINEIAQALHRLGLRLAA